MKKKTDENPGVEKEVIRAVMYLLTTPEVPLDKKNYRKLLEILFPLPEFQNEIVCQYLEKEMRSISFSLDETIEIINQQIASLPPRKRTFLQKRFGVPEGTPHTIQELAKEAGVTREKIRLAEKITLRLTAQLPIFQLLSKSIQEIWEENIKRTQQPPNES